MSAPPLAMMPPFDSICILLLAGLIITFLALRAGADSAEPAAPGNTRPHQSRNLLWAGLYVVLILVLMAALTTFGWLMGFVDIEF